MEPFRWRPANQESGAPPSVAPFSLFTKVRKQGIEAVSRIEIVDLVMVGVSIIVIVIALGILL